MKVQIINAKENYWYKNGDVYDIELGPTIYYNHYKVLGSTQWTTKLIYKDDCVPITYLRSKKLERILK